MACDFCLSISSISSKGGSSKGSFNMVLVLIYRWLAIGYSRYDKAKKVEEKYISVPKIYFKPFLAIRRS